MQGPTGLQSVSKYGNHRVPMDPPLVLRVVQPKRQSDLLVQSLIQECGKCQYEFSKVNHLVIIRVEYLKQILCIDAICETDCLAEFIIVDYTIISLGFA